MELNRSSYRITTIGIVAASKDDNSRFIEVYPIELLPYFEGEISDDMIAVNKEGVTITGKNYNVELKKGMSVKADWAGSTHMVTSPNVVKGEQVKLWASGSGDKFWWEAMGRDDKLRTRERVTWAFAARSIGGEPLDSFNSYSLTIDAIDKHITIQTSKALDEVAAYTAQINGKDGNVTIKDDLDNVIQLDSANTKITLLNAKGTYLSLDKKDFKAYAPQDCIMKWDRDFNMVVGRNMAVVVKGDYDLNVTGNVTEKAGGTWGCVVTGDYSLSAANVTSVATGSYTVNGVTVVIGGTTSVGITAPTIGLSGALTVAAGAGGAVISGNTSITGNVTQIGDMAITGNSSISGSFTAGGSVTCNNLVSPKWNGIPSASYLIDT